MTRSLPLPVLTPRLREYNQASMAFNETVFLTGFPGFIAGRLLKKLAQEGARFILLVQPSLLTRAREDVEQLARETGTPVIIFQSLKVT